MTDPRTDDKLYVRIGNGLYREATIHDINNSVEAMGAYFDQYTEIRRKRWPEEVRGADR